MVFPLTPSPTWWRDTPEEPGAGLPRVLPVAGEVAIMAMVVAQDARTTMASNLAFVGGLTQLDVSQADMLQVKVALPVELVPEKESWRLGL